MKAAVCLQHDANPETTDPKYVDFLKPIVRVFHGVQKVEWVWPVGVEVEGEKAMELVRFGLANPIDQECADACGMTSAQLKVCQRKQEMAQKGVHSKEDQELFLAGVIAGYESDGKGGLKYVDGPNAAAYRDALAAVKKTEEEDE